MVVQVPQAILSISPAVLAHLLDIHDLPIYGRVSHGSGVFNGLWVGGLGHKEELSWASLPIVGITPATPVPGSNASVVVSMPEFNSSGAS